MIRAPFTSRGVLAPVASVLLLASCNDSNPVSPPPIIPNPPKISCPAPITVKTNGPLPSVVYGSATASFGSPPVNIVCTPASGSVFPIGESVVTCTATDQLQRTDTCLFTVTVTVPPQISLTSFAAFGDSMTAGEVVSEGMFNMTQRSRPFRVEPTLAYPTPLQAQLRAFYTAQTINVTNLALNPDGTSRESGKTTSELLADLPPLIPAGAFQVLLLMAGANDLPGVPDDPNTIPNAVENMRKMILDGRNRGMRVFVATLPPEIPDISCNGEQNGGAYASVNPFNTALKTMVASQNAVLVDVNAAFAGKVSTLIDCDGLHPTSTGYEVIAETFFASIKQTLQVPSTPLRTLGRPSFVAVPVRRR